MQDPIHNYNVHPMVAASARDVLNLIRADALNGGWIVDEWDPTLVEATETGGPELYLQTQSGFGAEARFSLKALRGQGDHSAITVYGNTAYNPGNRVDNQPGMFARSPSPVQNGAPIAEVFAGLWDAGGIYADPVDGGLYQTPGDFSPAAPPALPWLNCFDTTPIDNVWIFWDLNGLGNPGGRVLAAFWYTENVLNALILGKVYYDDESGETDGNLLASWCRPFDDRASLLLPVNNSLGGERTDPTPGQNPWVLIRNRTSGPVTWPPGPADGSPLADVGTIVLSRGRLEAGDGFQDALISAIHRPDQPFDGVLNTLQGDAFPNPRISVHYEGLGPQHRRGLARHRRISLFPDGGGIAGGQAIGAGPTNWADSGYFLPWHYVPTVGLKEGDVITSGSRRFVVFPGNRGGTNTDPHRYSGIAMRISNI